MRGINPRTQVARIRLYEHNLQLFCILLQLQFNLVGVSLGCFVLLAFCWFLRVGSSKHFLSTENSRVLQLNCHHPKLLYNSAAHFLGCCSSLYSLSVPCCCCFFSALGIFVSHSIFYLHSLGGLCFTCLGTLFSLSN